MYRRRWRVISANTSDHLKVNGWEISELERKSCTYVEFIPAPFTYIPSYLASKNTLCTPYLWCTSYYYSTAHFWAKVTMRNFDNLNQTTSSSKMFLQAALPGLGRRQSPFWSNPPASLGFFFRPSYNSSFSPWFRASGRSAKYICYRRGITSLMCSIFLNCQTDMTAISVKPRPARRRGLCTRVVILLKVT